MDIGAINKSLGQGVASTTVGGSTSNATRQQPQSSGPVADIGSGVRPQSAEPAGEKGREQIEDAVASIQEFVQSVRRSINFSVEEGAGRVVVKVTDADSGDVIRQIPSEEALRLAENLSEVRSLLFEAEA